jgi:hypothetical protein
VNTQEKISQIVHVCATYMTSGHSLVILRCIVNGGGLEEISAICHRSHSKNSIVAHKVNAIINDQDIADIIAKLPKRLRDQA